MSRLLPLLALLAALTFPAVAYAQAADLVTDDRGPVAMPGFDPATHVPAAVKTADIAALLFNNGGIATGTTTESGVAVPTPGYQWSEVQHDTGNTAEANGGAGSSCTTAGTTAFRLADDFTVPAGQTWTIDSVVGYAYQTGATTAPVNAATLRIWSGVPGAAGSTILFGDITTNRLATTAEAQLYRIFNTVVPPPGSASGTTRRIWKNTMTVAPTLALTAGTYWVDYAFGLGTGTTLFCPTVTVPGTRTQASWNALQFNGTAWVAALDTGAPATAPDVAQDFPFEINGTNGTPSGPLLSATPSTLSFGTTTTVGTPSATQTVTLNNGGTAATTITAITSSNAAFTVQTPALPLTIAAGGSATFTVRFTPTNTTAQTGTISLTSNAPGSPLTITVSGTGASPTPPGTFPSTDTPRAIPDNVPAGITSTIVVPATATGQIADLDVSLNVTHTWVGDLIISLTRGAQTSSLADRPGTATTPPTTSASCSANNMVVIVDDGPTGSAGSLETACTGVADAAEAYTSGGRYTPNTPLSVFTNTPRAGSYVLTISDNAGLDTGTLNSWALIIAGATAGEGGTGALASRLSVAPNPMRGAAQIDLTVGTAQDVRVVLYDALGREVSVLLDRPMTAGQQAFVAVATERLPAGVYVVRATGTDLNLAQRVTVVR